MTHPNARRNDPPPFRKSVAVPVLSRGVLPALALGLALTGCDFEKHQDYAGYTGRVVPDAELPQPFTVLHQGDIGEGDPEFILMPGPETAAANGTDPEAGELEFLPDGSIRYVWPGTWTRETPDCSVPVYYRNRNGEDRVWQLWLYGDPLHCRNWHYRNTGTFPGDQHAPGLPGFDLNLWQLSGVRDAVGEPLTGKGVRTVVFDTAVDSGHEDLRAGIVSFSNVSPEVSRAFSYQLQDAAYTDMNGEMFRHGTGVAGIIGARAGNGLGSRGIAPDSEIVSLFLPELSYYQSQNHGFSTNVYSEENLLAELVRHRDSFRVVNESWSMSGAARVSPASLMYLEALADSGVSVSASSGNSFSQNTYTVEIREITGNGPISLAGPCRAFGVNCGFWPGGNNGVSPHVIRSGAVTASGHISSYSPMCFGIWIAAPGGEYGIQDAERAVVTTDVSGAGAGFANRVSRSGHTEYTDFNRTLEEFNVNGNYTDIMNGTSAAAAMTSGLLTLMYQAYPELNVWQARYLLAATARNDRDFPEMADEPASTGTLGINLRRHYERGPDIVWNPGWIENAAGYRYHGRFGFGIPDGTSAVSRALSCDQDPECLLRRNPPEAGESSRVSCQARAPLFLGAYGNTYECTAGDLRSDSGASLAGREISIETAGFSIDALKFQEITGGSSVSERPAPEEMARELRDRAVLDPELFCRDATMYFAESRNGDITPDKYQQKLTLQIELYSPAGTPGIIKNYWSNFMGIRGYRDETGRIIPYDSGAGRYDFRIASFYGERLTAPENASWQIRIHSFCPLDLAYLRDHLRVAFDYYER
ncbi:S8 family serine peptidase [Succinimonas amylolytica]|uniref:S8 family serine peptidase n=1 Tax=Succinimonas amylolytica TaxID=83769 RepID=UPI00036BB6F4|nr:S8 family serine peptidase [Succinimonas amylolytica]